jgi:hypothetical protein
MPASSLKTMSLSLARGRSIEPGDDANVIAASDPSGHAPLAGAAGGGQCRAMPISRQWWAFPCAALCAALALGVPAGDILAQEVSLQEIRQGTHIHGLAVSRADPTQLYIATHHGLFILKSAGKATRISPVQDFMGFAAHPGDASVFYASGHPQNGGISVSSCRRTWGEWTQVSPGVDGPSIPPDECQRGRSQCDL